MGETYTNDGLTPFTYVVGDGVEASGLYYDGFTMDLSNTQILITHGREYTWNSTSWNGPGFTDTYDQVPDIIGVSISTNVSGLDMSDISWDANNIFLNWAGLSTGPSSVTTITVVFAPVNSAPVATADNYNTDEDTTLNLVAPGVLANDTDDDGDSLTATLVDDVDHGSLTLNADGSFSYTPDANYNGADSFSYTVNDGTEDGNTVTVDLTVNAVNDAPTVSGAVTAITNEDAAASSVDLLAGASDVEGDTLSAEGVTHVSGDASGITVNGNSLDVDPSAYNHLPAGESEVVTYSYTVSDGNGGSVAQTASVTIEGVNDAPDAVDDTLGGNSSPHVLLVGWQFNATLQGYLAANGITSTIIDGSELESTDLSAYSSIWVGWITEVTDTSGTLADSLEAFVAAGGHILVEPHTNMLQYLPSGSDISETGSYGEDVVIVDPSEELVEGLTNAELSNWMNAYHHGFALTDYDQFSVVTENTAGMDITLIQQFGLGQIVVTGQDVSYHALYGNWHGATGTDSPQMEFAVNALTLTAELTDEDTAVVIDDADLLANDTDPDATDTLSISAVSATSTLGAAVTINGDGDVSYDPSGAMDHLAEGEVVEDSFTYTVSDGNDGTDTATVTFTVVGVNDAPSAPADADGGSISEHAAVGSDTGLDADSTDPEGDPIEYYFRDGEGNRVQTLGHFTINASTGVVTLAAAVNYEIATSHLVTIYAGDGSDESSTTFTIAIENVVEHLFTEGNDGTAENPIDFNALPDGAYDYDGAQYNALAGDDYVILPDLATSALPGHAWNYSRTFNAGAGNDVIQGGDGNDAISGGAGSDSLFGGDGNDRLVGAKGRDYLSGGAGSDKLTGSAGADVFIFTDSEIGTTTAAGDHDVITDFEQGKDKIDISALYDDMPLEGIENAALSGGTDDAYEIGYYSVDGKTWLEGDVTGDGVADFVIQMNGSYKLRGSDLIVEESLIRSTAEWATFTTHDYDTYHRDAFWV